MTEYYALVTGPFFGDIPTFLKTFVQDIPTENLLTQANPRETYFYPLEYHDGFKRIRIQYDDSVFGLLSHGEAIRFDSMLERFWQDSHPIIGMIVLAGTPEDWKFISQRHIINSILAMNDAKYGFPVVLAYQTGVWDIEDFRIVMRLEADIPILICDITNPDSVREVVIALLEQYLMNL